jgi:EmrB/QacA subfamily drug resistance transporter
MKGPYCMASPKILSAQEHAANFTSKQRTIALVVVSLAFVMDLLDSTIVNIAIPSIRTNLAATYSAIQWIVAGYSLAFAVLLVTGGRMGDVYGYKKVFMVGITGFTIASLLSGISPNADILIAARLLQGAMAALMVPQVMSLMQVMYKPSERAGINGLFGALGGMAASLGPVIGGLLIKGDVFGWDWRPIFLINVPIGIFGLLAAVRYLPDGKSSHPLKIDGVGTLIIIAAMLLFIFPLIQGREYGWPLWTYVMLAGSIPVFVLFAWWQKRKDRLDGSPLVLPALFKEGSFRSGLLVNLIFEMAMIGFFLTFGLLLQIGFNFSPIHAALTGLPVAFGIAMTMAVFGQKLPKLGRYALTLGSSIMGVSLAITTLIARHYGVAIHSWQLIPSLLGVGVGMGMVFSSLYAAVLNGVNPAHAGSASGTLSAVQQAGAAIGVALIGVVFFGQLSHAAPRSFVSVESQIRTSLVAEHIPASAQGAIIGGVKKCFVDRSREQDSNAVPQSCTQATKHAGNNAQLSATITKVSLEANTNNFTNAFRWSIIYTLGLLLVTAACSFLLPARFKASAYNEL